MNQQSHALSADTRKLKPCPPMHASSFMSARIAIQCWNPNRAIAVFIVLMEQCPALRSRRRKDAADKKRKVNNLPSRQIIFRNVFTSALQSVLHILTDRRCLYNCLCSLPYRMCLYNCLCNHICSLPYRMCPGILSGRMSHSWLHDPGRLSATACCNTLFWPQLLLFSFSPCRRRAR